MLGTGALIATAAATAALAGGVIAHGTFTPRGRLWGPLVCRGPSTDPARVALTFDDGPWPWSTEATLDALGELNVKAAFFVIGVNAARWPELVQRMHADGHLVENHTYDHSHAGVLHGRRYWLDQLTRTDAIIQWAIGRRPAMFRPPLGFKSRPMARAVRERGQRVITWTRRAFDGAPIAPETIVRRLAPTCQAGDIIVLHDGFEARGHRNLKSTVDAIAPLIQQIRERGLEPARLDALTGLDAYAPAP